jgi:hypothetical protein
MPGGRSSTFGVGRVLVIALDWVVGGTDDIWLVRQGPPSTVLTHPDGTLWRMVIDRAWQPNIATGRTWLILTS